MAHGWLANGGGDRVAVSSAGTEPKGVHPIAISVMEEIGIDISAHTSDPVERYVEDDSDLILTVCDSARESCPVLPGARRTIHRAFEDPDYPDLSQEQMVEVFRRIRDEIGRYSRELLREVLR
jgi:arsenate reductase